MLHRSRNSGTEFTGWNQLPCGPVLTPNISCTKLKIHSVHADSPIVPKHLLNLMSANLDVGPVYASQITKLRKRICKVEPAPLWTSSCKIQTAHEDSPNPKTIFTIIYFELWWGVNCVLPTALLRWNII